MAVLFEWLWNCYTFWVEDFQGLVFFFGCNLGLVVPVRAVGVFGDVTSLAFCLFKACSA